MDDESDVKARKTKRKPRTNSGGSDSGIDVSTGPKCELLNTDVPHKTQNQSPQPKKKKKVDSVVNECTSTQTDIKTEDSTDEVAMIQVTSFKTADDHQSCTKFLQPENSTLSECLSDAVDSFQNISTEDLDKQCIAFENSASPHSISLSNANKSLPSQVAVDVSDGISDNEALTSASLQKIESDSGFSACSPSSTSVSISSTNDLDVSKKQRYKRTADALQGSGLMEVTMKTAELLKKNKALQKEIEQFKKDSALFLEKVLQNPENADLREYFLKEQSDSTKN